MDKEKHKKIHIELHAALDQLFADFIQHHSDRIGFIHMPLSELISWSYEQTILPTEKE